NDYLGCEAVFGFLIEDDTAYVQLNLPQGLTQITRVDNISGGQFTSRMLHPTNWLASSGEDNMSTWFGFDAYSNFLQFADTYSDGIWRLDKDTLELSCYVDKDAVTNTLDSTNGFRFLSTYVTRPDSGEVLFYNTLGRNLMTTDGSNTIRTYLSNADLSNTFGVTRCVGGMAYDPAGTLYWGQREQDGSYTAIHKRDTNGVMSVLLSEAQMNAVHGPTYTAIGDIFYAPDGQLYIFKYRTYHGCIVTCDPAASNVADTLRVFMSENDLTNSAAQSWNVAQMGWYKGGLCWHHFYMNEPRRTGIFAVVPTNEPAVAISGPHEVVVSSSNVPYTCMLLLTNRFGVFYRYDHTSTAEWSIVGGPPAGVTLDGNLLSVADEPASLLITLQAATTAGAQGVTNTYDVALVPEPAVLAVALACCALSRFTRSDRSTRSVRSC
ncbi:MAG TPA: hypothetical protein PLE35_11845, partial [Lentisphaeria bacterium]|nr:hypothetical protein [Lentisphaeria bacterium]